MDLEELALWEFGTLKVSGPHLVVVSIFVYVLVECMFIQEHVI